MQKNKRIVSYTLDQIREKLSRGDDRTDWDGLDRKSEAELEADITSDSDADVDVPAGTWVRVPAGYEVKVVKKQPA